MAQFSLSDSKYDLSKLRSEEIFWRDHQTWFQDCGYMLRPRYMPDWKPSWSDNTRSIEHEDALCTHGELDATLLLLLLHLLQF